MTALGRAECNGPLPPAASGGEAGRRSGHAAGVTLAEMLIVLALIGLMAAISFPSVSSGVDRLRLRSAVDSLSGFFSGAMNWAQRRQQPVEILIDPATNVAVARSSGLGYERRLEFGGGVRIASIEPPLPFEEEGPRRFVIYPGGAAPAIAVSLVNNRGAAETVRIDPITGVPASGPAAAR